MTKKQLIAEWAKVNTEIEHAVEEYKVLKVEKERLLVSSKHYDDDALLPAEVQVQMQSNVDKYRNLVARIKTLNSRSTALKAQMDIEIANKQDGNV